MKIQKTMFFSHTQNIRSGVYNNILVITHKNPDLDGLGSMFAIYNEINKISGLLNIDINVDMFIPDTKHDYYYDLSLYTKVLSINDVDKICCKDYDLIIFTDKNSLRDIPECICDQVHQDNTIVIDHRENKTDINGLLFIDENSTSASEVVYRILKFINKMIRHDSDLDYDTYKYIALGILSDSLSLMNAKVSGDTFKILGECFNVLTDRDRIEVMKTHRGKITNSYYSYLSRILENNTLLVNINYLDQRETICYVLLKKDYLDYMSTTIGSESDTIKNIFTDIYRITNINTVVLYIKNTTGKNRVIAGTINNINITDILDLSQYEYQTTHRNVARFETKDSFIKVVENLTTPLTEEKINFIIPYGKYIKMVVPTFI